MNVAPGSSVIFVGANGGGKTRLAVHIENALNLTAHRISAHRALALNPDIPKISERFALHGLRTGNAAENARDTHRVGSRWRGNMATSLLDDFGFLIQALFAEQSNKSLETHRRVRSGDNGPAEPTKFERLAEIWERLLPHRQLHISGDNIEVSISGSTDRYKASEMSDGERAIFYMIGQALVAADNSLLIVDEPELHVHRSIMSKLWDELESARRDCAFVFITHDLEFAASRVAQKFVIREYNPSPQWTLEGVPEDSGFDEEIATLILGSRRPILFVEGKETSLDTAIYRCCFPDWTVISRGSCEEVIHSVVTMRRNKDLTRVTCSGLVDADDYDADEIAYLAKLGISVLPVSEIENLFLLPEISRAIAESDGYSAGELDKRVADLEASVFSSLTADTIYSAEMRYCRRRLDRLLKKLDLSDAVNVAELSSTYRTKAAALDVDAIATEFRARIQGAISNSDLNKLLANYDNKALMTLAAQHLKSKKLQEFKRWLTRALRNENEPGLIAAIRGCLPTIGAE